MMVFLSRKLVFGVRGSKDGDFSLEYLVLKSLWDMRESIWIRNLEEKLGLDKKDLEVVGRKVVIKVGDLFL